MRADKLQRILRQVIATTLPLTSSLPLAVGSATLLSGCLFCGSSRDENHTVTLPSDWSIEDGDTLVAPSGRSYGDGADNQELCEMFCADDVDDCALVFCAENPDETSCSSGQNELGIVCTFSVEETCGRRPGGLVARKRAKRESPIASFLAASAHLEAASVDAFEILRSELTAHGAPRSLRRAAGQSAKDERRHARIMRAFARRAGARVERPRVLRSTAPRPLLDIALENAREGNINETYGAIVALWQSQHAGSTQLRAAYARIARDEARHAALAFRVANWIEPRLTEQERRLVHEARKAAIASLHSALAREPDPELSQQVGVPSAVVATTLFTEMTQALPALTAV